MIFILQARRNETEPWLRVTTVDSLERAQSQLARWELNYPDKYQYRIFIDGGDNETAWGRTGCWSAFDASAGAPSLSDTPPF